MRIAKFISLYAVSMVLGVPESLAQLRTCPGSFAGDLTVIDCSFTASLRFEQLVNTSLTDQAILGATGTGAIAWLARTPAQWPRTWLGLGDQVGSRYTQNAAKGLASYLVGAIDKEDLRYTRTIDDPAYIAKHGAGSVPTLWPRVGHALQDAFTDRKSQRDGKGRRGPAYARILGAAASGFMGEAWNPSKTTGWSISFRAGSAYAGNIGGSLYNEFSPEVGKLLGLLTGGKK